MTENRKRTVRRLVEQGLTVPQIAKRMRNISQQSIHRLIRSEGLTVTPERRRLPGSLAEIKREILARGSVESAATHYGVTRAAVYYRLKQGR